MSSFLTVNNLSKKYGNGPLVISDMNHRFTKGTATGLIGENGSGKTTFLRLMSVMAYPTSGEITLWGKSIHKKPHQYLKYIGMVTDTTDLPEYLNAGELLEWLLRARKKWSDKESPAAVERVLTELRFDERRNNLIGTYSSGMVQKTMLACSLVTNPQIILLDEPFRALDTESVEAAIGMLLSYKKDGGTILISSHHRESLTRICDEYISFPAR
ncbi:ABC transporter ATP-binding protein [Balneolaceae bacterium ANBcel3]|nr:ABC transporter ATP-binding protein [Balneolaceae bacterium ANBcel3]